MKIIIFGASGDLAKKKLFPALSKLNYDSFEVIGYSRSNLSDVFTEEVNKYYKYENDFPERILYISGDVNDLTPLESHMGLNTIIYLALPPSLHKTVLDQLKKYEFKALAIDKPFGIDLVSMQDYECVDTKKIHFIDHYLLKSLMIVIPLLFKEDPHIPAILNNEYVKSIKCYFVENILANGRDYFNQTGIIKDVVQNHLIEVLASILCDKSINPQSDSRRAFIEQLKIDKKWYLRGQYKGYAQEFTAGPTKTETFAMFNCKSDIKELKQIPITMIAGKGLDRKATEIVFNIKEEAIPALKEHYPQINDLVEFHSPKIIFNIAPQICISIEGIALDYTHTFILYEADYVNSLKGEIYGEYIDYEIIFHGLTNSIVFPSVSFKEAVSIWKLFENLEHLNSDLIYYKIGSPVSDKAEQYF